MAHKETLASGGMLNAETRAHARAEKAEAAQAAQTAMDVQNAPAEADTRQQGGVSAVQGATMQDRNGGSQQYDPKDAVNNPDRINKMIDAIWDKL